MGETRTGAQIIWECLVREGVTTIFGYPGGAILPAYDAMLEYPIHHVLVRHEQGAAHMADGYARASGGVGVAIATSGPGATNLVTGIATAMMDSVPLVCITGQVPSHLLGYDAFQETDVTGITLPITKHNYLVTRAEDIMPALREALHLARSGRPGPVLVDITKDAQQASVPWHWDSGPIRVRGEVKAGFETLVEAGYQPEIAYFECLHELKLIVDLMYRGGLRYMRHSVSDTAEHGDYTGGPRVVTEATRTAMRQMLRDVQSGEYAKLWMDEYEKGQPWFAAERDRERHHPIEEVGARLRAMMPFLDPVELEGPARV